MTPEWVTKYLKSNAPTAGWGTDAVLVRQTVALGGRYQLRVEGWIYNSLVTQEFYLWIGPKDGDKASARVGPWNLPSHRNAQNTNPGPFGFWPLTLDLHSGEDVCIATAGGDGAAVISISLFLARYEPRSPIGEGY